MNNYAIANTRNITVVKNRHFGDCMKTQKPCVIVEERRLHASVELDLFPTMGHFNDHTYGHIDDLLHQVSEKGAIVRIGLTSCSTSKVRIDVAKFLARHLYQIGIGIILGVGTHQQ